MSLTENHCSTMEGEKTLRGQLATSVAERKFKLIAHSIPSLHWNVSSLKAGVVDILFMAELPPLTLPCTESST